MDMEMRISPCLFVNGNTASERPKNEAFGFVHMAAQRLAAASEELARVDAEYAAAQAEAAILNEQHARRMTELAAQHMQKAVEPFAEADFEAARALCKLRSPPQLVQLIVRCACTLVSVDIPAFRYKMAAARAGSKGRGGGTAAVPLPKYADAKKIL